MSHAGCLVRDVPRRVPAAADTAAGGRRSGTPRLAHFPSPDMNQWRGRRGTRALAHARWAALMLLLAGKVLRLERRVDVGPRVTDTGIEDVAACCPRLRSVSLRSPPPRAGPGPAGSPRRLALCPRVAAGGWKGALRQAARRWCHAQRGVVVAGGALCV